MKYMSYILVTALFVLGGLGPAVYLSEDSALWTIARVFGSTPMPIAFSHFKSYEYWAQKVDVTLSFESREDLSFYFNRKFLDDANINHQLQTAYMIPVSLAPSRSPQWWEDSIEFSYCKKNGPFRIALKLDRTPDKVKLIYQSRQHPSIVKEVEYSCSKTM